MHTSNTDQNKPVKTVEETLDDAYEMGKRAYNKDYQNLKSGMVRTINEQALTTALKLIGEDVIYEGNTLSWAIEYQNVLRARLREAFKQHYKPPVEQEEE